MPRTQGVLDLLARVRHPKPRLIADLGCGPGNNTELIARRWPEALVIGLDSSADMIAAARERERPVRDRPQRARAALPKRALERALLASRLVGVAA